MSTPLTVKAETGSPYQLSAEQVLIASRALIKTLGEEAAGDAAASAQDLLAADNSSEATPIYLLLTTKTHIVDTKRLKPSKISLPHPLNNSATTSILLITASPQRTYKDLVASPAFPVELGKRIVRVIDIQKLSKKYKTYEAQRQLRESAEIVIADERIITRLPKVLGKTFYGTTKYRPIPVSLAANPERVDGKRVPGASRSADRQKSGTAQGIAKEIQKAVDSTLVHLSPSTNTSIKVGLASWKPEDVAANVAVVVERLIEKFVPKQWRGVRSIHIKGPETVALPVWLASELWADESAVLDEGGVKKAEEANISKKRKNKPLKGEAKRTEEPKKKSKKEKATPEVVEEPAARRGSKRAFAAIDSLVSATDAQKSHERRTKKTKTQESNDDKLDVEIAARKELLKRQKLAAEKKGGDEVPKPSKKARKAKDIST
ncbi:ribosomal protein L1p/L10e family-domain-containing protein [Calycina marina]|uniref:Ribosomal protein L1p/L10e family-domain-containing protein n=1 Tax=Calycina marina TaxID=1763456 RepID=A0A9P8CCR9_9HELO|nr:ribosomal protein L1p/L10e family-domain-containing protein [Calycina marina]